MDYISATQLERYQKILDEINQVHQKCEDLKRQIDRENDKIIALKLVKAQKKTHKTLCHTTVKVFNNIFELYELYSENFDLDTLKSLAKYDHCKYYLIEMQFPKLIVEKFLDDWYLNFSIHNEDFNLNKSLKFEPKTQMYDILPVVEDVLNCTLEINLYLPSEDKSIIINLDRINIDASYFFENYQEGKSRETTKYKMVLDIMKQYNPDLNLEMQPKYFEYKITANLSKKKFATLLLKNCYHRLNIELLSELSSEDDRAVNVAFSFRNGDKCVINYDSKTGSIKLKATPEDLFEIKKYIFNQIEFGEVTDAEMQILEKISSRELRPSMSLDDLIAFYEEHRKLMHQLPV